MTQRFISSVVIFMSKCTIFWIQRNIGLWTLTPVTLNRCHWFCLDTIVTFKKQLEKPNLIKSPEVTVLFFGLGFFDYFLDVADFFLHSIQLNGKRYTVKCHKLHWVRNNSICTGINQMFCIENYLFILTVIPTIDTLFAFQCIFIHEIKKMFKLICNKTQCRIFHHLFTGIELTKYLTVMYKTCKYIFLH